MFSLLALNKQLLAGLGPIFSCNLKNFQNTFAAPQKDIKKKMSPIFSQKFTKYLGLVFNIEQNGIFYRKLTADFFSFPLKLLKYLFRVAV